MHTAVTLWSGSMTPGPPTWISGAPIAASPLREHLGCRRPPDAHDDIGDVLVGEALVAEQRGRLALIAPSRCRMPRSDRR